MTIFKILGYSIGYHNNKLGIFKACNCCGYTGFIEEIIAIKLI